MTGLDSSGHENSLQIEVEQYLLLFRNGTRLDFFLDDQKLLAIIAGLQVSDFAPVWRTLNFRIMILQT
jgi:hypothetical protein